MTQLDSAKERVFRALDGLLNTDLTDLDKHQALDEIIEEVELRKAVLEDQTAAMGKDEEETE